jgi:curved DNA-binding protein CbpA
MTFVDFYELLQISPNAEAETIQRVYRMLAARYHPDNPHTGHKDSFIQLNEAYEILSDPASRAAYDAEYQLRRTEPIGVFNRKDFSIGIDGEENRRMGLLCLLYSRRRTNPEHAGLSILEFERMMSMAREHLMFSLWYLREKELIRQDEGSDFVISAAGVDHVEKNLPRHDLLYKLLKSGEAGVRTSFSDDDVEDAAMST